MSIVFGVLGGALYAVSGYLKSGEKFDYEKFLRTIILGVLVGFTNTSLGLPVTEDVVLLTLSAGEVAIIENLLKALIKHYRT